MRKLKGVGLAFVLGLIVIQFFPVQQRTSLQKTQSIIHLFPVPATVRGILETSCFDCHSNTTNYPWYMRVQPAGWFMANHINEGRGQLNFDEFGKYSGRRQVSKLKSIANSIQDGSMPLASYTFLHKNARLSQAQKTLLISWATKLKDQLQAKQSGQ